MKPSVSVIVPVYNVEPYLVRCLDSLQKQSLKNIEIVLVDDASPDRCGEICEQYAVKDTRFKVIHHTENKGLAAARNTGIRQATADYLMFVDSDDYVHENFCKEPYECAIRFHADLVMFRRMHIGFPKIKPLTENTIPSGYKTRTEAIDLMLTLIIGNGAWNKLYNKNLFRSISYPSGHLFEDIGTTYKIIWKATSIYYLDTVLYYYCYRSGSIITRSTEKSQQELIEMCMQQYRDLVEWGYSAEKQEEKLLNIALSYCIRQKPVVSDVRYNFCKTILNKANILSEHFTWKRKLLLTMFNCCPPAFELLCTLCNKKYSK